MLVLEFGAHGDDVGVCTCWVDGEMVGGAVIDRRLGEVGRGVDVVERSVKKR